MYDWNYEKHKLYESEQLRKAERERLAQQAQSDNWPTKRRRFWRP